MILSVSEESLINDVRMLPPDEARKVLLWAQQLADLGGDRRVEWSDSWSDDDLREATLASLERFEKQEPQGLAGDETTCPVAECQIGLGPFSVAEGRQARALPARLRDDTGSVLDYSLARLLC
jgi:hypothetical protein